MKKLENRIICILEARNALRKKSRKNINFYDW